MVRIGNCWSWAGSMQNSSTSRPRHTAKRGSAPLLSSDPQPQRSPIYRGTRYEGRRSSLWDGQRPWYQPPAQAHLLCIVLPTSSPPIFHSFFRCGEECDEDDNSHMTESPFLATKRKQNSLIHPPDSGMQQPQRDHTGRNCPAKHKDQRRTKSISCNARQPIANGE